MTLVKSVFVTGGTDRYHSCGSMAVVAQSTKQKRKKTDRERDRDREREEGQKRLELLRHCVS